LNLHKAMEIRKDLLVVSGSLALAWHTLNPASRKTISTGKGHGSDGEPAAIAVPSSAIQPTGLQPVVI